MSDTVPFAGAEMAEIELADNAPVFRPTLPGHETEEGRLWWGAYGERQDRLNEVLRTGGAAVRTALAELDQADPELGITLNNVHNTTVTGKPLPGLMAPLAVFSGSKFQLDMPGLTFTGGVASEVSLKRRDLRGSDFTDSVIPRGDFTNSDLRGARFINAIVNGADFTGAKTDGADFAGAWMIKVRGLTAEQVRVMNLRGARFLFIQSETDQVRDLSDLLGGWFSEGSDLTNVRKGLEAVRFAYNERVGRLMSGRVLRGFCAFDLIGEKTSFTGSDLTGSIIDGWTDSQASLRAATIGGSVIRRATLPELDLMETWAPGVIFEDVIMPDSNLSGANLVGSVFRDVDLSRVTGLESANTEGIIVEDTRLPKGFGYDGVALQMSEALQRQLER